MKFECPQCGQRLAVETMHQGQAVKCPNCGQDLTVPEASEVRGQKS